jgi:hypothetical protein
LLDCTLRLLEEIVTLSNIPALEPERYNQAFEAAVRLALRRQVHIGDLAVLARTELRARRARLEVDHRFAPVLILECTNAISALRVTAVALETAADRAARAQQSRSISASRASTRS